MSLQWHSPQEAAVAEIVWRSSGVAPTRSECSQALYHNRHGSVMDAAFELLEKYAVERRRLELLALEQRPAADIVRAETRYVQPQQPAQGYVNPAGDVDPRLLFLSMCGIGDERVWAEGDIDAVDGLSSSQQSTTDGAIPLLDAYPSSEFEPSPLRLHRSALRAFPTITNWTNCKR